MIYNNEELKKQFKRIIAMGANKNQVNKSNTGQ